MSSERAGTPTRGQLDRGEARAALGWTEVGPSVQDLILDNLEACVVPDPRLARIEVLLDERERRAHNEEGYTLTGGLTGHLRAILRGDQ